MSGGTGETDNCAGTKYPLKIEYGDFGEKYLLRGKSHPLSWSCSGPAEPQIQKAAGGSKTNNIKLTGHLVSFGIVFDEGRQVAMKAFTGVSTLRKITLDEVEKILNDCDPIEAPPGEYRIQPEKQGEVRFIFAPKKY